MNSTECEQIINNFLYKDSYPENWISASPESPTDEERTLYECACERLKELKRINDETERRIKAKKEAKEHEIMEAINYFINELMGGVDNCCDLLENLRTDMLKDGKAYIRELREDKKMKEAEEAKDKLYIVVSRYRGWKNELEKYKTIQSSKDRFIDFINNLRWD